MQRLSNITIDIPDAHVCVWPAFFSRETSDRFMHILSEEIDWKQERLTIYGKTHDLPRLTAWYGDIGKVYRYSGIELVPKPWIPALLEIKDAIEGISPDTAFNSVLLNMYRSGRDCVSWHSDDEPELGSEPIIGSVSLGQSRSFQFKHKKTRMEKRSIVLNSGDYMLMKGSTQKNWLHQVPRSAKNLGPRINLTFRQIGD